MKEHQKEAQLHEGCIYGTMKQPQSEQNKYAITDHIIGWDEATIIDHESDRTAWWMRETVKIRQKEQDVMNYLLLTSMMTHYFPRLQLWRRLAESLQLLRKRQQYLLKGHIFIDKQISVVLD